MTTGIRSSILLVWNIRTYLSSGISTLFSERLAMNTTTENHITVTVLVDGNPEPKTFPTQVKVHAVIVELLPPNERSRAGEFQLTDASVTPPKVLSPDLSLEQNGVKNGDLLSLTKKDGGGGTTKV